MTIIAFLLLAVFLLTLQTIIFPLLPAWLGKPDLLFLLVVFLAYRSNLVQGAVLVVLTGFFIDIFSGVYLGLYPSIYLLVYFLLKAAARHIALTGSTYQAPFAVASYLLAQGTLFISSSVLAQEAAPEWSWRPMLLQLLLLAVLAIPLFSLFESYLSFCARKLVRLPTLPGRGGNRLKS